MSLPSLRSGVRLAAILIVICGLSSDAVAQDKRARAVRIDTPPRIDGLLDDPAWSQAAPFSDFVQSLPVEGADPFQRTVIRIVYDDDALYLGAMMYDTNADSIVARPARRDDEIETDGISFRFDTFHDRQTAYEFTVSAAGTRIDILQYNDGNDQDESWDAVWEAKTFIGADGWSAEIRIPFSMLRFLDAEEQLWGMQVIRRVTRSQEVQHWALKKRSESGSISRFGLLTGIRGITAKTTLELLPYTVIESSRLSARDDRARDVSTSADVGIDLKYRPTPNLTIDGTINPDFGQVEADPAVLNLSTFETFYPERRPFFVEGVQIFKFATFGGHFGPGMFYSRRIGRPLQIDAPDGGYVEREPGFATILGAVKVSGKTTSGFSYGVLEALTRDEYGDAVDSLGNRVRVQAEPKTNFALVRLRQDFGRNSNAGMIFTNVSRPDRIPAITGGIDWDVNLLDNLYQIDGFYALSRTARTGDLLEGSSGKLGLSKTGGEHWRGSLSSDFTSRDYNINDIGFFRRPGDYGYNASIQYREDLVSEWSRDWRMEASIGNRWNIDDVLISQNIRFNGSYRFLNYWEVRLRGSYGVEAFDDRETRGLGLYRKPANGNMNVTLETDPRAAVVFDVRYRYRADALNAAGHEVELEAELKPADALTIELSLQHERNDREFAWVENVTDPAVSPDEFSVFGDRFTRSWDLLSRGTYVFTSDMTLQWYVQVFIAKGRYSGEKRRIDPYTFVPYAYRASDFTEYSVNSNLVLRWEYTPGSTLYLVWSHARQGDRSRFIDPLSTNLRDTFRLPPDNVLLLKLSYWLGT